MSDRGVSDEEVEAIIDATIERVSGELILPLLLGMTTLTTAVTLDVAVAASVAAHLRKQAHTCPPAGRAMLLALAHAAQPEAETPTPSPADALRASLRLLQGGKSAAKTPPETQG